MELVYDGCLDPSTSIMREGCKFPGRSQRSETSKRLKQRHLLGARFETEFCYGVNVPDQQSGADRSCGIERIDINTTIRPSDAQDQSAESLFEAQLPSG